MNIALAAALVITSLVAGCEAQGLKGGVQTYVFPQQPQPIKGGGYSGGGGFSSGGFYNGGAKGGFKGGAYGQLAQQQPFPVGPGGPGGQFPIQQQQPFFG